ncbi:hypothetical protein RP75_05685 [Agrobacterium arsenijevicii]|uniref:Uncharacterized protein n=1 Tax=Agrobacterium arsenijevicii TaxID=1585697 RepID=A0ABR5DBY8_9HYPH|nr:hypothetical protein RP75_05685 [Agrobacterium arsenijevicii]
MSLRRKFFSTIKENISCGILFRYVCGEAPKIVLNYIFVLNLRCASPAHNVMKENLRIIPFRTQPEMLFH